MGKKRKIAAALSALMLFPSAVSAGAYETYLSEGTVPSLKEAYAGKMDIGVPAECVLDASEERIRLVTEQCSMLVCDTQTRGKNMLDRGRSKKDKNPERVKVIAGKAAKALSFAEQYGMKARAATIVGADDIPEWFFTEDYAARSGAKLTDRETMLIRTENAIHDQMDLLNGQYPNVITEWTVIHGNLHAENDLFRTTIGEDYIPEVFAFARKYAAEGQKLFWHLPSFPDQEETDLLQELYEQGLADGVIFECSLTADTAEIHSMEEALQEIAVIGLEIRLSGLEIADTDRTAAGQIRLASRWKAVFAMAERLETKNGRAVRGISFAAIQDEGNRKEKGMPPRLFDVNGKCSAALFGALQDDDIPMTEESETIREAAEKLDLDTYLKKEEKPVIVYKKTEDHNPVMTQRFGADPWAMVYKDRVYLYMTGDEPVTADGGRPKTNDYSNIVTLRVLSSDDLVNWTDHGSVRAAGGSGAASWAANSWAPCAAWKNIDGEDRFFLYFANSGGGIGVLTSNSPTGPFTDPIGKPLVSRLTPSCASVTWLFDPAVLVDDDGSAYLYFGGGVPEGKAADPGTARVVKLGEDMISLDGEPTVINPPWLFEDSGINKFGDIYVYSYCSNFDVPASGSPQGFGSGEIVYMTSENPMGPFTYAGRVLRNPSYFFGVGGNNHHCMFQFRGQWYITYHAATIDRAMGWNAGYRSTFVDRLELNGEGLPAPSKGTTAGVAQLNAFNPYKLTSGSTAVTMAGMSTVLVNADDKKAGTGMMASISTSPDGWICVTGADFGDKGADTFRMTVRSEVPGGIEILTDDVNSEPILSLEIPAGNADTEISANLPCALTGTHDLYFRFTESGISLLEWRFQ